MTTAFAERSTEAEVLENAEASPRPFHWSVEAYYRAWEAGVFSHDGRLELIHGRILDQMPQSSFHANLVEYLAQCLRAALAPQFRVRDEKPVRIAFDGEPVPDITVVTGPIKDIHQPHPTPEDVVLLAEVSVSTADYDLGEKALLYAQAGIADYWVVLPERGQIVVHREPGADGYASVQALTLEDTVSPLAAEEVTLSVRDLLGLTAQTEG